MAAQRQAKIERYRQKKELETRLSDVKKAVESGQADDEVRRKFYLMNVQRWVTLCLEEIESIDQEVEILKKMDSLKQSAAKQPAKPVGPPMKPFILTKNAVQVRLCRRQVFKLKMTIFSPSNNSNNNCIPFQKIAVVL